MDGERGAKEIFWRISGFGGFWFGSQCGAPRPICFELGKIHHKSTPQSWEYISSEDARRSDLDLLKLSTSVQPTNLEIPEIDRPARHFNLFLTLGRAIHCSQE